MAWADFWDDLRVDLLDRWAPWRRGLPLRPLLIRWGKKDRGGGGAAPAITTKSGSTISGGDGFPW